MRTRGGANRRGVAKQLEFNTNRKSDDSDFNPMKPTSTNQNKKIKKKKKGGWGGVGRKEEINIESNLIIN